MVEMKSRISATSFFASGGNEVTGDGLSGEQRGPGDADWTLLTKVETSCDRILIAGGANVEAEWEQGPAV